MKVCWISFFPLEWLPDAPAPLRQVPRYHPATWQRVLLDELKTVPGLKLHVIAVRKHFPPRFSFTRDRVCFHTVRLPPAMRMLTLFWWETFAIRRWLRQIQPDIIHAWGTERGAALVASRCRYPYLVTLQGLLEWCDQMAALDLPLRLEARLEPTSLRRAAVATVESQFGVNWLAQHYPHLEVHQAEHAPNWLFHRLDRRPQARPLQFLSVGSMSSTKGTDLLLRGLDALRTELDFHLTIVGSVRAGFLQRLKRMTSAALWERLTMRNNLSQPEVAEEMARATMVLFPTRVDNSPNSVKESAVGGVPVVASATGGIPDYIKSGLNGITFTAGNLEEFVKAVRLAVAHPLFGEGKVDPATLAQVKQYLSPAVMAQKFLGAYQRVLERAGKGQLTG